MLWQPGVYTPAGYICRGWNECLDVLDRLDCAPRLPDDGGDTCQITGAGWITARIRHCPAQQEGRWSLPITGPPQWA